MPHALKTLKCITVDIKTREKGGGGISGMLSCLLLYVVKKRMRQVSKSLILGSVPSVVNSI